MHFLAAHSIYIQEDNFGERYVITVNHYVGKTENIFCIKVYLSRMFVDTAFLINPGTILALNSIHSHTS